MEEEGKKELKSGNTGKRVKNGKKGKVRTPTPMYFPRS